VPESPDIDAYRHAIEQRLAGAAFGGLRFRRGNTFPLKTVTPSAADLAGETLTGTRRIGKRIILHLTHEYHLAIHLMRGGRLRYGKLGAGIPGKVGLVAIDFDRATLTLTDAAKMKEASLHLLHGVDAPNSLDPGGIEPATTTLAAFRTAITQENRTAKRALTDPRFVSGIGGSYADEILHAAFVSPLARTQQLSDHEVRRLHAASRDTIRQRTQQLIAETDHGWPKVTAFRPDMNVHGKYGHPCPRCGDPIQRIQYVGRETNYCATCQTGGKVYRDRGLSALLKDDWPSDIDAWHERLGKDGAS
jgi:formamidopyrimidine-DNA glycosylase